MSDYVVDQIRRAIYRGELEPGDRLIEWDIANELGVSRGPVREALRELAREGLILAYPNRGASVMGMSDAELLELLLPIRLTIEHFAATTACARVDDETIAELERVIEEMRRAAEAEDTGRLTRADLAFHRCIVEAGGQAHAVQLWQSIHPRIQAQLNRIGRGRQTSLHEIPREHEVLLSVFRASDENELATALERHILHDAQRFMPPS